MPASKQKNKDILKLQELQNPEDKKDFILIMGGGAMAGIFGAGVVTALEKSNIYSRIHSIYAVSAGAQSAAYFLCKKSIKTTEIYSKYLPSKRYKFISKLSPFIIFKKIMDLMIFRKNMHIMDLEILKIIQRTRNKLNTKLIKNSDVKFYVRVFDLKNLEMKFKDAKRNTLEMINVSSNMPPYMYMKTRYKYYYDGETVPSNSFLDVIKKNKDKQIIFVLNERSTQLRKIKDIFYSFIDFVFKSRYLGIDYMTYHLVHFWDKITIEKLKTYENVHVIYPQTNIRKMSKNTKKLRKLYLEGVKRGEKMIKKLGL